MKDKEPMDKSVKYFVIGALVILIGGLLFAMIAIRVEDNKQQAQKNAEKLAEYEKQIDEMQTQIDDYNAEVEKEEDETQKAYYSALMTALEQAAEAGDKERVEEILELLGLNQEGVADELIERKQGAE